MITDLSVNLKAKNKQSEVAYRLLPKTVASNVQTTSDKQFVSAIEKARWDAKLSESDKIDEDTINGLFD